MINSEQDILTINDIDAQETVNYKATFKIL